MLFPRLHNFWLPKAYVLSLAETPAREVAALHHLNKELGFSVQPYHGFNGKNMKLASTEKGVTPGMIGCQLGHMSLWKTLIASSEDSFLIFEDDILLPPKARTTMFKAYAFDLPDDWNVVFWGYCWAESELHVKVNKSFFKAMLPPMCFHAYMLKKQAAQAVLPQLNCHAPLDVQTRRLFQSIGGVYVFSDPTFARQRSLVYTEPENTKLPVVSVDAGLFRSQTCERKG